MQKNIKYRSDIDGLRALAVLSVLIFHFNDSWLPGGYLGVDIFFVISGYLITSIIKRQIEQKRFSFKDFYTRRIKRILPLFFTVLFVTFIFSALILMPEDYKDFWRSARYAMQFRANRAFTGSDYFELSIEEKPLLHLWSLAIEEQFYFIWPLCILICYFFVKRRAKPFLSVFWLSVLGIVVSTFLAEISISREPENSYYLLQNRAAELLVGCALALNPYHVKDSIRKILGMVGILILVVCFIFMGSTFSFPGIYALIPTIAAALFIFDSQIDSFYKKIFTNKVVRLIGLWSFSLYLWHWPILAFMRYLHHGTELSLSWIAIAATVTFVLSLLTYYFIENPVRKNKLSFSLSLLLIYLIPMGIMMGLNSLNNNGLLISNQDKARLFDSEKTRWFRDDEGCWDNILNDCSIGDKNSSIHYLIIGDSHAMHLSSMMELVGSKEGVKFDLIASTSCPVYFGYKPEKAGRKHCIDTNQFFEKNWGKYDGIIISQLYHGYIGSEELSENHYLQELNKTVSQVGEEKPVILISDIPAYDYDPLRDMWFYENNHLKSFAKNKGINQNYVFANEKIKRMVSQLNNKHIRYLDITPYILELLNQEEIIYRDFNHINPYGSRLLGEMFIQEQNLLLNRDHNNESL